MFFIGLNTADYFDKQIFALAHELCHYYTKTSSHLSRLEDEKNCLVEALANRFAAEFLLPESVLRSIVFEEFNTYNLKNIKQKALLRFIARLHCTWWLPYRSLVKRLKETNAISDQQYEELYSIDERDIEGEYGRIGRAINKDVFQKLNTATNTIGASPKHIEIVIRNYEDNIIDEDKFINTLLLFDKSPEDFGYDFRITEEEMEEFHEFFWEDDDDES